MDTQNRHVFKPAARGSATEQHSVTSATALPEPSTKKTPVFPMFMGVFSLILSLVPVCVGIYEFQLIQKPSSLPLAKFDALFRKAGSFLPFVPFTLRGLIQFPLTLGWLVQGKSEGPVKIPLFFRCLPGAALHVGIQGVRLALYGLHVMGQQHDVIAGDLLADHCVLGVAVQTALAFEVAAALYLVTASRAEIFAAGTYTVSATTAWILLVLVSFDMRDTSKYFHHAEESLLGVALGVLVFALPMCYMLLMPVLQRKQSSRQNGYKLA